VPKIWFPVFVFISLTVLILQGSLELTTDSMIFPWVIGGVGFILLIGEIWKEVAEARQKTSREKTHRKTDLRAILTTLALILGILPLIYLLGYLISIPLYTLFALKFLGERWRTSLTMALSVGLLFYLIFVVALKVPFYEGILPGGE
jgi:small-conductance mechanosensitive channel